MRITIEMVDIAAAALAEAMTFRQPADAVLSQCFRRHRKLGMYERGFVADTVYGVLRRRRYLEHFAGPNTSARRLVLLAQVKLNGLGLRQLEGALKNRESGWIAAQLEAADAQLSLGERVDMPDWLCERLLAEMDETALTRLAKALNASAPLDLRANPLKTTRDAVLAQLAAEGLVATPGLYSPLAIRMASKPALAKHPLFLEGQVEVQDEGSQLLAYLLAPKRGEMVVDFCAGAGGKTLLLGALMRSTGRLYAFDVADKRLSRLRPRVARSGLSNVHAVVIANENDARVKRLAGKIDRVLVDAPCSGLGTLRRNPDLKWRQTAEGVADLAAKQRDILAAASRLVKPGGRLVYATCSILAEENEAVVDAFLAKHSGFSVVSAQAVLAQSQIQLACGERMRLSPHEHGTDGFYAAVLERSA